MTTIYRLDQIDRYITQYLAALKQTSDPERIAYLKAECARWEALRPDAVKRQEAGAEPPAQWWDLSKATRIQQKQKVK